MNQPINEYEAERRQKREKLREMGIDPYGSREENIRPLAQLKAVYTPEMGHDAGPIVKGAGRIVLKRDMGKLSFVSLRDESGDLQVALDKKRLDETAWGVNQLLDLGDQIVVEGPIGVTKKGEITIWATGLKVAAKSLLSPPGKWDGLSDIELRYRQRYVDLWANPEVMAVLKKRMAIVQEIRSYLVERGFVEVETPMMQSMAGGAAARPFVTHHNALDIPLYMRIAPELYLKRLLVGGFRKVFEMNRNFRNEGISPRHNPEFTMLELYEAFGSWETMADLVEGMICHLAQKLFGGLTIIHREDTASTGIKQHSTAGDEMHRSAAPSSPAVLDQPVKEPKQINLSRPWRRASMAELVEQATGWKFSKESIAGEPQALGRALMEYDADGANALSRKAAGLQLFGEEARHAERLSVFEKHLISLSPAEQLVELYEKLVEPTLIDPCFVTQIPSVIIPLAKKNASDPYFADVYELAINGQEISPGYTELNDPDVQASNFAVQVGDEAEKQKTDEDFLNALKYGMPPAGGLGLGIDRLVMMLTGAQSIRDVILFPLMRPL